MPVRGEEPYGRVKHVGLVRKVTNSIQTMRGSNG